MATTVVTPAQSSDSGNGTGFFLGAVILLLAVVLFFIYGLPYISHSMGSATSGTNINVPDKVNVTVQHTK